MRKKNVAGLLLLCALLCTMVFSASAAEDLTGTWELIAMSEMTLTEDGDSYKMADIAMLPSTSSGNIFTLHGDGSVTAEAMYLDYIPAPLREGATWTQEANGEDVLWLPSLDMSSFQLFTIDDFTDAGLIVCETPEGTVSLQYKLYSLNGKETLCIQQNTPLDPEGGNARFQSTSTYFRKK